MEAMIEFAKNKLPLDINIEQLKRAFPFHAPFFTDEGLRAFKNQRSIVTSLGQTLIPKIAQMVALDRYQDVHREYLIAGTVDEGMVTRIRQIVGDLRAGKSKPDARGEWGEVLAQASNNFVQQQVIADLYIGDFTGGPLFIEIKTPRPNLDICAESKQKMLIFRAIMYARGQKEARAYLGLWYNPDIDRDKYSHNFTRQVMDMDHEVLLGEELWDTIGGPGTYDELLEVLDKAGRKIRQRRGG